MANTYSQIYLHFVFAVQNRLSLISPEWEEDLYKYMGGIISNKDHKSYIINGMPDHIHAFVSMNPKESPSDLIHDVKRNSSLWINENKLVAEKFSWQEGFGVFSYGKSQIDNVYHYIKTQKEHHATKNFMDEYRKLLDLFEIDYDERYIFKEIE